MLNGLKVLDFSRYLPGPYASYRLAEWGADVVKVETKPFGDPARRMEPFFQDTGAGYLASNSGKKSLLIDLRRKSCLHFIHKLIEKTDVVLEGYRPGVANNIGIGYQQAKELNPKIIYCSLSGYGQEGTMKDLGGHDINAMAISGMLQSISGQEGKVNVPDITIADLAAGMAAAEAILAAYIHCLKTGEGSYLDISLVDVLYSWQGVNTMISWAAKEETSLGQELRKTICYQVYETKEGRYVALGAYEEKFWKNFCSAVGKEDWIPYHRSPALTDNPIYNEVKNHFRKFEFSYWIELAERVDACLTPVFTRSEAFNYQLAKERGFLCTAAFKNEKFNVVKAFSGKKTEKIRYIAELGEHSEEVLKDWLSLP